MTEARFDWRPIKLVAFDVDGTLYAQRPLRLRMAARLIAHSLARRDHRIAAVLGSYRARREELGDAETEDFETRLVAEVADKHGVETEWVRKTVTEWMEERPLPLLGRCRYPAVEALFDRIRRSGRTIGILSDYPAAAKLTAMALKADHVISAGEIGILKPHPRGLRRLMELAGATPGQTVMIGDRAERDGEVARRAGTACLLRSKDKTGGWVTFTRFDGPVFDGIDTPLASSV